MVCLCHTINANTRRQSHTNTLRTAHNYLWVFVVVVFCSCLAASASRPFCAAAGIFGGRWNGGGGGGGSNSLKRNGDVSVSGAPLSRSSLLPPPPPPGGGGTPQQHQAAVPHPHSPSSLQEQHERPLLDRQFDKLSTPALTFLNDNDTDVANENCAIAETESVTSTSTEQQVYQTPPPPPGVPLPPQWPPPPLPHTRLYDQFQHHQQQQQQQQQPSIWDNQPQYEYEPPQQQQLLYNSLQQDLDVAYQLQQQLVDELHNVTAISAELQQREKLHMHQLDVLTERVMEVETVAARDRNRLVEYQVNCTELSLQLKQQQTVVDECRTKCNELVELRAEDEVKIRELKKKVKAASREAEELAAMIERHRLLDEGSSQQKKKPGFFAWLFGFGGTGAADDQDDYREMHETARSTLLAALRTERNSVSELETAVATLQQNNSAIAEQVHSRDQILDELNDRIAVFEEDKVVLKAALRQLQLEMNDEAPKTLKLVDDLADAQKEVERLAEEIESLMENHQAEIAALQKILHQKQEEINAAESNLTVIGTYVDKLEERLADFTVARRDIEKRELECTKAEQKAKEAESQRDSMTNRVNELEQEHEDLKKLLTELAQERTKLQKENERLASERVLLQKDVHSLRQSYAQLDNEAKSLRQHKDNWRGRTDEIEHKLNETLAANERLLRQLNISESEKLQLRLWAKGASMAEQEQQSILNEATSTKQALERRIAELEAERRASVEAHQALVEDTKRKLEAERQASVKAHLALVADTKRKLEEQRNELEAARREQQKAIEETQRAASKQRTDLELSSDKIATESTKSELTDDDVRPVSRKEDSASAPSSESSTKSRSSRAIIASQPPYLPRASNAPKREFGSGLVGLPPDLKSSHVVKNEGALVPASQQASSPSRKVPLRKLRKFFAKTTGIHGLFKSPSHPQKQQQQPRRPPKVGPSVEKPSSPQQKPNVITHTMAGIKFQKPTTIEKQGSR